MEERLAKELLDASNNTGASVKKKEDMHKMAGVYYIINNIKEKCKPFIESFLKVCYNYSKLL